VDAVKAVALFVLTLPLAPATWAAAIDTPEQAVEAAKRWMKARCTERTPCKFRAERQGKEWRVWVHPGKPKDPTRVILFFDRQGNLLRRIDGE
jgi:hypothetical protein